MKFMAPYLARIAAVLVIIALGAVIAAGKQLANPAMPHTHNQALLILVAGFVVMAVVFSASYAAIAVGAPRRD